MCNELCKALSDVGCFFTVLVELSQQQLRVNARFMRGQIMGETRADFC